MTIPFCCLGSWSGINLIHVHASLFYVNEMFVSNFRPGKHCTPAKHWNAIIFQLGQKRVYVKAIHCLCFGDLLDSKKKK